MAVQSEQCGKYPNKVSQVSSGNTDYRGSPYPQSPVKAPPERWLVFVGRNLHCQKLNNHKLEFYIEEEGNFQY